MGESKKELTSAVEDYLKSIYALEVEGERATTSALAERMSVSAPSATAMMKRLDELRLVERAPYHGVELDREGPPLRARGPAPSSASRALPRRLPRHVSGRGSRGGRSARARALGEPRGADRRSARLPDARPARRSDSRQRPADSPSAPPARSPISASAIRATVVRVPDGDAALLRYLAEIAIVPGQELELTQHGSVRRPADRSHRHG